MRPRVPNAAVAWEAGKPLVIEEVEVAPPQKMEVRIKILFTSLCHTDVYFWEAKGQNPVFPRILGHEAGGVVESVGEGVTDLQPGDHVLPVFTGECKECAHWLGATLNVAKPKKGSSVAVFGLGAVGLAAAEGARIAGASRIIGVDLNANRFELVVVFHLVYECFYDEIRFPTFPAVAWEAGKPLVIEEVEVAPPQKMEVRIKILFTSLCHTDVYFWEAKGQNPVFPRILGHEAGGLLKVQELPGWGVAVLVGVPHKDAVFKTSPMNLLNERTLKGTFFGNYKPRSDIPSVVEKYMNKELELEKFITHEVPFSEINKAFELMLKGEGLRLKKKKKKKKKKTITTDAYC
ncbi:Alcohol dehydrogenase 1 [Helianthus annuus]|nr:Alcohol dehydrogenase 1 [Helianthus annuus]